jgi:hypothetical protein
MSIGKKLLKAALNAGVNEPGSRHKPSTGRKCSYCKDWATGWVWIGGNKTWLCNDCKSTMELD